MKTSWNTNAVLRGLEQRLLRGLTAGAILLTNKVKQTLSVPAPRKRVVAKRGKNAGSIYYRATAPATRGAPPRKLGGPLRANIAYQIDGSKLVARVGSNLPYAPRHEMGAHPFLLPTLQSNLNEIRETMRKAMGM